jgi:hypothetical protein
MGMITRIFKLNSKILMGFLWTLIAIIYIAFRLFNFSEVRIIDWIAWGAMLTMGIYSIFEGLKLSRGNKNPKADIE